MKFKIIILVAILGVLSFVTVNVYQNIREKNYKNDIEITQSVQPVPKEDIKLSFENEESFLFVVGSKECPYCINYKENTLMYYINDSPKYPLYFMNIYENFSSNQEIDDYFLELGIFDLEVFPTTYLVIDGKVQREQQGVIGLFDLIKFINKK